MSPPLTKPHNNPKHTTGQTQRACSVSLGPSELFGGAKTDNPLSPDSPLAFSRASMKTVIEARSSVQEEEPVTAELDKVNKGQRLTGDQRCREPQACRDRKGAQNYSLSSLPSPPLQPQLLHPASAARSGPTPPDLLSLYCASVTGGVARHRPPSSQ